jgi:hypothetical protein
MPKFNMRLEYYFVVDAPTEHEAYVALETIHSTANFPTIFESYQKDTQDYLPLITDHSGTIPVHYDGVELYEYKKYEEE